MKRLKEFLELVLVIKEAWPLFLSGFLVLVSALSWLFGMGSRIIQFSLPLWFVILIIAFALFPIAKFLQLIIKRSSRESFSYGGLLWKPAFLWFKNPTPICPFPGCGLEIFYKYDQKISVTPISGTPHFEQRADFDHIYECPDHGRFATVPNIPIKELSLKAKSKQIGIKSE